VRKCLYCPPNQAFNTITRNCEPCPASKPVLKNYICEACPSGTTFDQVSNSCQGADAFIDPSVTNKVPVYTTVPTTVPTTTDDSFIDPSTTAKVPAYSTSPN